MNFFFPRISQTGRQEGPWLVKTKLWFSHDLDFFTRENRKLNVRAWRDCEAGSGRTGRDPGSLMDTSSVFPARRIALPNKVRMWPTVFESHFETSKINNFGRVYAKHPVSPMLGIASSSVFHLSGSHLVHFLLMFEHNLIVFVLVNVLWQYFFTLPLSCVYTSRARNGLIGKYWDLWVHDIMWVTVELFQANKLKLLT